MGKLKPVQCGCGGKAVAIGDADNNIYFVKCDKCWISTDLFHSKTEAIEAWNRAMSGTMYDCAKDARCNERTAKATRNPQAFFYHCECGYALCCEKNDMNYCPNCGVRLDWSGNESL